MDQQIETTPVSGTKFFVVESGKTNGAHHSFVARLKDIGFTEVNTYEESDFLMVFCPIASRVGTDISTALENIPDDDTPVFLLVMHHTFETEKVVAESKRLVNKANVKLTVDCLFYEGKLLKCEHNDNAWIDIQKHLEVPSPTVSSLSGFVQFICPFTQGNLQKTSENREREVSTESDIGNSSGKKFSVIMAGKTNGAHQVIVAQLQEGGHTLVHTSEESDYLLAFCPIVSRAGTDISTTLENITGDKPAILVVMHHTFEHDKAVAESKRLVNKANVKLTVDCLFYEGSLLDCKRNKDAWNDIRKHLGIPLNSQTDKPKQQKSNSERKDNAMESHKQKRLRNNDSVPTSASEVSTVPTNDNYIKNWRKFSVDWAGRTNGAHEAIVSKLQNAGHTLVNSPETSDYRLIFCPIVSRVELDISKTLKNITDDKPVILVVMHHTFNRQHVVVPSKRLVNNPNICLTVDCLFYEGKLLPSCQQNSDAWTDIKKYLAVSFTSQSTITKNKGCSIS